MPNYRSSKYGMVSADLLDPSLTAVNDLLKLYLRNAGQDFEFGIAPKNIQEVFRNVNTLMANDFRAWLAANYNDGVGLRSDMVRRVLGFLSGELTGQLVVEGIRMDQIKVRHLKRIGGDAKPYLPTPTKRNEKWHDALNNVLPNDFYSLVEGIGLQALVCLMLTLSGETGDV